MKEKMSSISQANDENKRGLKIGIEKKKKKKNLD